MENYIENIELINAYLNKQLGEDDVKDFENRLLTDVVFKKEYDTHTALLGGIKRKVLKNEIKKAKHAYIRNKWLKVIIFISVIIAVLTYFAFSWFNAEKKAFKSKLNFESEYIQHFRFANDSIVNIVGEKGTKIQFHPNDLQTVSKQSFTGDSLIVELIELTTKQDLLLANAQTVSNGKWLVSGGAFKINIKTNTEMLVLKEGKTVAVQFPKNTAYNDMQLFYGERKSNGDLNWERSTIPLQEKKTPYVIFLEEQYIIDTTLTIKYGVDTTKGVYVIDSLGYIDLGKTFPKINYINKGADTIRFYKKGVWFMEAIDIDCFNCIEIDSMLKLKSEKEIVVDSVLYDLDELYIADEIGVKAHVYKQISKKELGQLIISGDAVSKAGYKTLMGEIFAFREETNKVYKTLDKVYKTIQLSKLGWINIDRFAQNENKVNVKLDFNLKTHYNSVYVIDNENNTVLNVYNNEVDLPVNRSFNVIAFGIKGKSFYGFKKSVRFSKKGHLKIEFKAINDAQIKSFLKL